MRGLRDRDLVTGGDQGLLCQSRLEFGAKGARRPRTTKDKKKEGQRP